MNFSNGTASGIQPTVSLSSSYPVSHSSYYGSFMMGAIKVGKGTGFVDKQG